MENLPSQPPHYEAPSSWAMFKKNLGRILGRPQTVPPSAQAETLQAPPGSEDFLTNENQVKFSEEWEIPERFYDGKTVIIFGRAPNTDNKKYTYFPGEHRVKLLINWDVLPRRIVGFVFQPDGSVTVKNIGSKDLTFGLTETDSRTLKLGEDQTFSSTEDLGNFRVDLPGGLALKAGSVGGSGNERPKIMTLQFTKTKS